MVSWLDFVLCRFCFCLLKSRCYSTSFLHLKKPAVWVVDCDKFETFLKCLPSGDPTIHCVFMKNEGGLGENHANTFVATKNRPSLIIISFKIYLESFTIQKLLILKCFAKFSFSIWKKHLIWNRFWISCELFSALEVYLGNTPRLVLVNIPVPAQRKTF